MQAIMAVWSGRYHQSSMYGACTKVAFLSFRFCPWRNENALGPYIQQAIDQERACLDFLHIVVLDTNYRSILSSETLLKARQANIET